MNPSTGHGKRTATARPATIGPSPDPYPSPTCRCGCGAPLTARQRAYASRACTQRAQWADPAKVAARIDGLRRAKARTRATTWLRRADLAGYLQTLGRLDSLSRADHARLVTVLTRVAREQYQAGYHAAMGCVAKRQQTDYWKRDS